MPNIRGFSITFLMASYETQFKALKGISLHKKLRSNDIFCFDTSSHEHQNYPAWDARMTENVLSIV